MYRDGDLDENEIEIAVSDSGSNNTSFEIPGMPGANVGMINIGEMIGKSMGNKEKKKKMTVKESHEILINDESDKLIEQDKIIKAAIYLGGDVSPVDIKLSKDELFANVIANVTKICKSFHSNIQLDYCGVIRWPTGTFMKPHYDKSEMYSPNILAAFLYLNDDYIGGHTQFDNLDESVWYDVKPKTGKLLIFSNREYLHHVSKVDNFE